MMWRDTLELLNVKTTDDEGNPLQNDYGEPIEEEIPRTVFANKKSARQSEFYQALAVGMKPDLTFEIREIEYTNEPRVMFEGERLYVIRTYSKNGEILELICSRSPLKE